jgi:hypothetical protein
LMVKGSALALLPLAGVTYLAQAFTWRDRWREVLRAALVALGVVLVIAGWWYVRSRIVYGSSTGAVTASGGTDPGGSATLSQLISWAKEWTGLTYRTYWWHYHWYEAPGGTARYFLPAFVGFAGMLGLVAAAWSDRRRLFDRTNPRLRQIVLMVVAVLSLYVPFLLLDLQRRTDGAGFYLNGGRYLLPAFAAAATLFVIGVNQLVRREIRPLVLAAIAALATLFSARVFEVHYVDRYFGEASLGEQLRRISFDRPEFVTPATLGILLGLAVLSLVLFAVVVARGALRTAPTSRE